MLLYILNHIWIRGGEIATAAICLWALWRGGTPERIGAVIMLIGWALTDLLSVHNGGPGTWVLAVDAGVFASYLGVFVWYRRPWSLFAAASMLLAVASHYIHRISNFGIYAFGTMESFWGGWAIIICLAWGVADHRNGLERQQRASQIHVTK